MKHSIAILLSLLLLAACGAEGQASAQETESSPSTVSQSVSEPEMPSDTTPEPQRNETVEMLLREYNDPPKSGPTCVLGKPSGLELMFSGGNRVHVPIPSLGPGLDQTNDVSLRYDAVVIAYGPEDNADTVSVLSTVDQGQSWQSSGFEVKDAGKYNYFILSFQDAEKGILVLCERTNDNEPIYSDEDTGLIFATEDTGATWGSPVSFPTMERLYKVTANQGCYCIVGEIGIHPVILKSGDGRNWEELTLPLDADRYLEGYCKYAAFSGDTGLAVVVGTNVEGKTDLLYLFSEDGGQSWSLYE